jgi:DNA-binding transcriptional regulator PaaX
VTPESAAARLNLALLPGNKVPGRPGDWLTCNAHAVYAKFAREVTAEASPTVLAEIVETVERHSKITRRAA